MLRPATANTRRPARRGRTTPVDDGGHRGGPDGLPDDEPVRRGHHLGVQLGELGRRAPRPVHHAPAPP
ncbi:hypothetical protein A7K94_0203515 [Modestobacter sp. VKM Ac-2676]|nr:hypothetical protein A7K94_0203515 [Modestobacter sp. VKM Ac-2676]